MSPCFYGPFESHLFQFKQIIQTAPHGTKHTDGLHIPIPLPVTWLSFLCVSCFLALIDVKIIPWVPPCFYILHSLEHILVVGNVEMTPLVFPLSAFVFRLLTLAVHVHWKYAGNETLMPLKHPSFEKHDPDIWPWPLQKTSTLVPGDVYRWDVPSYQIWAFQLNQFRSNGKMLSFHVKFVQTDRRTDGRTTVKYSPNLLMRGHKKLEVIQCMYQYNVQMHFVVFFSSNSSFSFSRAGFVCVVYFTIHVSEFVKKEAFESPSPYVPTMKWFHFHSDPL